MSVKKILLVDSEIDLANACSNLLTSKGFEVHTFHTSEAAINQLNPEIDLLITDMDMDEISGIQLAKAFSSYFLSKNLARPILFTSGMFDYHPKMGIDQKLFFFLEKPFQTDDLLLMVSQILNIKLEVAS